MSKRIILVVVAGFLVAGCGGGSKEAANTTSRPSPPAGGGTTTQSESQTTQTETQAGGIDTMPGASTQPVVVKATNKQTALLTAVRAARHEGYDRVVFEFANALPGYDIRYVQPPVTEDGSGKVVPVKGSQVVRVRMENALDADLTKASAPRTYTGPVRFSPGTPEVVELVRSGGFEGVLSWVVGLQDRVDYRVKTLQSPPRLVVDFRNH